MKYGVSPNTLLITAGTIWSLAGVNILRIGLTCWIDDRHYWLFKVCEASLVFLLFFGIIFHRLYKKHTLRISQKKGKHCPFSFFDVHRFPSYAGSGKVLTASLFILSGLLLFPGNFQAMLWPLALILIGIFLLRHHHRRNWTHQRTVHRRAKMVQRMMNKRMGEQEEHSTRRNLHRPGLQLGRSGTAHTRRLASTHRMQLLLRRM